MLHRSFKPAKCKTSLKLAVSRSKLLKNKKEVAVKQLKRELAQLLEHGQEQTARIRVEHVVREEKMMAAYELIEIFCELIAVRLPIIESQKNCPIDLKEAVTSVIFAAPRCSDIPELADVRKHFTAKYGKEFVTAAIELRPDSGVNRNLVEKLSAKAPDGPTKVKILTAIAEEHNITWDAKSFGEKDSTPQEDLLNGPKPFENDSRTHVESSNVRASYYDRVPPAVHTSPESEGKQEGPINSHGNNSRSSFSSQNVGPTHVNAPAAPSPNLKPSGNGTGRTDSNSYSEEQNPNFVNRQNWNMEFTDATSAAQAAAESAERASIAARAAAELSRGNIRTEYSPPSQGSSAHASRNEVPRRHSGSSFDDEAFTRGQRSNNLEDRTSRSRDEKMGTKQRQNYTEHTEGLHGDASTRHNRPNEMPSAASTSDSSTRHDHLSRPPEHRTNNESSQSYGGWNFQDQASIHEDEDDEEDVDLATLTERLRGRPTETGSRPPTSKKASSDSFSNKASPGTRRNSQDLPHPEDVDTVDEFHMRRQSQKFEAEHSDQTQDVFRTEKATSLEDEIFRLHPADASSYSRSSSSSSLDDRQDDVVPNSQNVKHGVVGNPFAVFDGGKYYEGDKTTKESASVQFDDYDSDGENAVFDLDKGPETSSHIFSPDRKPTSYPSEDIYVPSPRRNSVDLFRNSISESPSSRGRSSASVFSESVDDPAARVHDDELPPVKFDDLPESVSESEEEPQDSDSDREDIFSSGPKRSQLNSIGKGSAKFDDPVNQPHHSKVSSAYEADEDTWSPQKSAFVDDSGSPRKSSSDGASEFSFGKLTGGRRNRGYMHPPYVKGSSGETLLSKQAAAGETKESHVSDPQKTWSSSEVADDAETPKRVSPVGTYGKSSLGEASAARTSSGNTAKRSSFLSAVRKESIDYEVDLNTRNDEAEYKTLSGRLEEKPMRSSSGEAPLSTQAPVDASMKYGFSSPPRNLSVSRPESDNSGVEPAAGKRSSSRDSISLYESQQRKDPKEEVASPMMGSKTRYGAGLSRRTKGSPSKTDRGSPLKSPPAPEEEEAREQPLRFSSRSSDTDRRSQVKSVYSSEEGKIQERRADRDASLTHERRADTLPSYSPPERRADTKSSSTRRTKGSPPNTGRGSPLNSPPAPEKEETREPIRSSSRSSGTDRRSQVKPMYRSEEGEVQESRASRESSSTQERRPGILSSSTQERPADTKSSSRSSYGAEAYRSTRSERSALDNKGSSDRLQPSKQAMEKPKSETPKYSERPSGSSQTPGPSAPSASSEAAKPSLEDTSRENSFNRASHVHPKLPDYDTIAALLRGNRK